MSRNTASAITIAIALTSASWGCSAEGRPAGGATIASAYRPTPAGSECRVGGVPAEAWTTAAAAQAGWNQAILDEAWAKAEDSGYAAGMLIYRGQVVGSFGDVSRPYQTRSIRKSLLNAVIGQLVASGKISLDATLGDIGIDDVPALTAAEKQATVRDLLMSRSGVYHAAAYATAMDNEDRPERGSHAHGTWFWYNNWDFNALGSIVEKTTGAKVYDLFRRGVADPTGMQDFGPAVASYHYDADASTHPAYLFDMSTRDRARLGLLYLNGGCWNGHQILRQDWVRDSTSPLTDRAASGSPDYGYLWWSQRGVGDMKGRLIMARGNAHQYITLIPEADAVLVVTNDMGRPGWVNWVRNRLHLGPQFDDYGAVLKAVVRARPREAPPA